MMKLARPSRLLLCLALAAWALAGCARTPPAARRIRFVYDYWPGFYPVILADRLGYFAAESLQVEIINPANTAGELGDFAAGKYDLATMSIGDIVNLSSISPDLRVILATDESRGADAIVATPGIRRIADLRGRRVGYAMGTYGEVFVEQALAAGGLTLNDVEAVSVEAGQVDGALARGDIAAGHTWEPYVSQAVAHGAHTLHTSAEGPTVIVDIIAARQELLGRDPEAYRAFVRAWFRAVDFWVADTARGSAIIAKALNQDPASVSLAGLQLYSQADNLRLFTGDSLSPLRRVALMYVEQLIRRGAVRTRPDLTRMLDPGYLPGSPPPAGP